MKISLVIITYNEENNIARCLESVKNIADEIVLIDSYSIDKTVEIARTYGAVVFYHKFNDFGEQKAFAIKQATYDWILSVDADEVLSPELQQSILKAKSDPHYDGYNVNILTNYCGKWIRHCGWYPQPKLRFFNKNKYRFNTNKVHEGIVTSDSRAKISSLQGNLLHYSYKTISDHTKKIELYSELAAINAIDKGERISLLKILFGPPWKFFYHYILRLGFLDGYIGYVICKNIAYSGFIKYIKIKLYSKEWALKNS